MSAEIRSSLSQCKALICVGETDFGRCPQASRIHRAFWTFGGKPVLLRLVEHMAAQGIRRIEICSPERNRSDVESLHFPAEADVRLRFETLLRGTAGNIRDALASESAETTLFVFNGAMLNPPPLPVLLEEHRRKAAPITFFLQPSDRASERLEEAGIYLCQPDIVRWIPSEGYFDLKENLVPVLVQKGRSLASSHLKESSGTYRTWKQFRDAVGQYLSSLEQNSGRLPEFSNRRSEGVWTGDNVQIDSTVSLVGPVLIGSNSVIKEGCFLFGPLLIESDVWIGPHSTVSSSILGAKTVVGANSYLNGCWTGESTVLTPGTTASDQLLLSSNGKLAGLARKFQCRFGRRDKPRQDTTLSSLLARPVGKISAAVLTAILAAVLIVVYWNPTLIDLWQVWMRSDEYSSGILVPFLAAYLIWDRRKVLLNSPIRPFPPAFLLLLVAQILRLGALLIGSGTLERFCLFLTIGGLIWLILGLEFFKKVFPVWLYLIFMFPLPRFIEWKITIPLQKWATLSAVFSLEALGFNVIREGNIININGTLVAVAEACNGLRMLTAFFVVSGFVVLICRRPLWEKVLIFVSSVPIALLCNTVRLVLTSIAFLFFKGQDLEKIFHDYGGLAMMPLALALILLELWFLSKLFVRPAESVVPVAFYRRKKEL